MSFSSLSERLSGPSPEHVQAITNALRLPRQYLQREAEGGEWRVLPYGDARPLLCFLNPKSGGQAGPKLMAALRELLTDEQVFDLTQGGPAPGLRRYIDPATNSFYPCQVVAAGGDGTVGWVLSVLDQLGAGNAPPVGTLPLGTGNDMARSLGWGPGFDADDSVILFLLAVMDAKIVPLDRWQLHLAPKDGSEAQTKVINNYYSIGVDAHIALEFHEERERHPERFKSRLGNKAVYARLGTKMLLHSPGKLARALTCEAPAGRPVELHPGWEGLIVSNLPCYQAGHNFWGTKSVVRHNFAHVAIADRKLEVMAVDGSMHMARLQGNIGHAHRLAQCDELRIATSEPLVMQIDGEPWRQPPSDITISFLKQSLMLIHKDFAGRSHITANATVTAPHH